MRVLLAIDHLGIGGAQRQLTNLAVGLRDLAHEVDVFVYYAGADFDQEMSAAGVRVIRHVKGSRYSLAPVFKLAKLLRSGDYDVAVSFLDTPNLYLELASLLCRSVPVVVSERSQFVPGPLSLRKRLQENFHRFADRVVANSHTHGRRLVSEFSWLKGRVEVIYNGVKPVLYQVPDYSGGSGSVTRVLVVATVVPIKNALSLAHALCQCLARGMEVYVQWAGRHPRQSADYIEQVNAVLREGGAQAHWEWLGERRDVPDLLAAADVVVHASHVEGFPNAVCEAMAAGRPVLASHIGDVPELVADGESGLLFDPDDVNAIVNALQRYVQMPVRERVAMASAARLAARENWTIRMYASRFVDLFDRVSAGPRHTSGGGEGR